MDQHHHRRNDNRTDLSSESANYLFDNYDSKNYLLRKIVRKEIDKRFNEENTIIDLLKHANYFLVVDRSPISKTGWKEKFRHSIEKKSSLTRSEWGNIIKVHKWFFEEKFENIPNYINDREIALIWKEKPEFFNGYSGHEKFFDKYESIYKRLQADRQIPPEDLQFLPIYRLVEVFLSGYADQESLRNEVSSKLKLDDLSDFAKFLEAASEFLTADPDEPSVSGWREEFRIRLVMLEKNLEEVEWGKLINKHKWYFYFEQSKLEEIVPKHYLAKLCHYNQEYFSGYKGSHQFVEKHAGDYEKIRQEELRNAFIKSSIILDLEYNATENKIEQIGYRHLGIDHEWPNQKDETLEVFLTEIERTERNAIIVGHNIIDWDLRKLREAMGKESYLTDRPVWDTLVVQTLLEPWLVSHAMTGADKAHDAISDVAATRKLFSKQLEAIKPDYEFLKNTRTPWQVLKHIRERIASSQDARKPRSIPKLLSTNHTDTQKNILIPEALIDEYQWVPELRIERLSREIPTDVVTRSIAPNDPMPEIALAIIEDLKQFAEKNKIDLYPRMLPRWVAAHSDANECRSPLGNENDSRIVRSYEYFAALHAAEDFPWNEWFEPCPQLRKISMVISGPALTDDPCPNNEPVLRYLHPIPASFRGGALTIFPSDSELWIERAPSRMLTALKPWQVWDFTNCRKSRVAKTVSIISKRPLFRVPQIFETLEDKKQIRASHSMASPDRNACWSDLVSTVQSILDHAIKIEDDVIHIVLLDHCDELEKADELFANLNWAPGFGRKRFQRLSSLAGETNWKCLVGRLEDARFWQRASEHCGVKVEFILPEIPIDRWAIAMHDYTKGPEDRVKNDDKRDPAGSTECQDMETANGSNEQEDCDASKNAISTDKSENLKDVKFPTSFDYQNALNYVLPCWKETMFPDHTPWMLDPRIKDCAPNSFIQVVEMEFVKSEEACSKVADKFAAAKIIPRDPNVHKIDNYEAKLRNIFGHSGFRPMQRDAAIEIGNNEHDVFVGLPTGGGKSCLFQIPALIEGDFTGRLTVVVSPLKALMRDQVSAFREKAYEMFVDYLSGDLDPWSLKEAQMRILEGKTKLLYVAPERFRNPLFQSILKQRCETNNGLAYVVLDEAHCFWLWGNDFRPDYFYAVDFLRKLREEYSKKGASFRFLLFSATVTEVVFEKLKQALKPKGERESILIRSPKTISNPIRPELVLEPIPVKEISDLGESLLYRCNLIQKEAEKINLEHSRGLLFVAMRKQAEDCAVHLQSDAEDHRYIEPFHAGMSTAERNRISEQYEKGTIKMIAATKAFGMGMDVPNIHMCFHLSPPCYLEDYLQEVGRSARNAKALNDAGLKSVSCRVYWDHSNLKRNRDLVAENTMTLDRLYDLHQSIIKNSYTPVPNPDGHKVAVVFSKQVSCIKTDPQLRTSLGWLERKPLKRIELLQSLPHILELKIRAEFSPPDYNSVGIQYRAAILLKNLIDPPETPNRSEIRFLGMLVAPKEGEEEADWSRLILSVRGMMEELNLDSLEAAYAVLWKFVENHDVLIAIQKTFQISGEVGERKKVLRFGIEMRSAVAELISETGFFRITKSELERYFKENSLRQGNGDIPDSQTRGQLLGAILQSADRAGLTVQEDSIGGEIRHTISVTSQEKSNKLQIWRKTWQLSLELSWLFPGNNDFLDWNDILTKISPNHGWNDLNAAMGILRRLGMLHFEQSFYTTAYLVKIIDETPLVGDDHTLANDSPEMKVNDELMERNEYNRLRELAMELWLQIPDDSDRKAFITDYFEEKSAEGLNGLMTKWLGKLGIAGFDQLLTEGRKKAWEERTKKLKNHEPRQFYICARPFWQDLLIYAGPGAGKTEVLIHRAADLIHKQGLRPENVLIVAFNRAVVNEIRKRVSELFDALGYGSYVEKLQIETFHSLAIKHLPNEWADLKKNEAKDSNKNGRITQEILEKFIASATSNSVFAQHVSKGLKTILVDEFQDMNDDLFKLLIHLRAASRSSGDTMASITVIGDDDQDILGWYRGKNTEPATQYFNHIRTQQFEEILLETNFRSVPEVIKESQSYLNRWLSKGEEGRSKKGKWWRENRKDIGDGGVTMREGEFSELWSVGITKAVEFSNLGTCALLCRSNKEAISAYELLKSKKLTVPLRLLGGVDLRLCLLRHVAEMIDEIRRNADWGSRPLIGVWNLIKRDYPKWGIPDAIDSKPYSLELLKDYFLVETASGTAEQWCKWLEELKTSDAQRILYDQSRGITVSTIHKVKGLQFDSVVILPSCKEFPFSDLADMIDDETSDQEIDNFEKISDYYWARDQEARLYYVALTRARDRVWLGWGEREKSWSHAKRYDDQTEIISGVRFPLLVGSLKEVWLGYAAYDPNDPKSTWSSTKVHERIKNEVEVGWLLNLDDDRKGRYCLYLYDFCNIGKISKKISAIINNQPYPHKGISAQVSAVYRFHYRPEKMRDSANDYVNHWTDEAKNRGWCYVVLVNEIVTFQQQEIIK